MFAVSIGCRPVVIRSPLACIHRTRNPSHIVTQAGHALCHPTRSFFAFFSLSIALCPPHWAVLIWLGFLPIYYAATLVGEPQHTGGVKDQGPSALLANLSAPAAISFTTSVHTVEQPGFPLENLSADAPGRALKGGRPLLRMSILCYAISHEFWVCVSVVPCNAAQQ
jgi:hypothetical protein